MRPDAHVEEVLASIVHHVLIRCNASCFKGLARDLLFLIGHHVYNGWKLIARDLFLAGFKDADLWVWHTTAEARLRIWLVLAVPVALVGATTSTMLPVL